MYIRSKEEEIFRASLWQIWANLESLELRERRRRKVKTNSSKLRLKKQMINRGDRHIVVVVVVVVVVLFIFNIWYVTTRLNPKSVFQTV